MTDAGPSRRRFIQGGLLFGAAAFGLWHAWGRRPIGAPVDGAGGLKPGQFRTLEAAFVEFLEDADAGRSAALELDGLLATDADQAAQLGLALSLLEFAPGGALRGRRFSRMTPAQRVDVLRAWQTSGLGIRRMVHQALRQAARFIYFSRPEQWAAMGYDGPWVAR